MTFAEWGGNFLDVLTWFWAIAAVLGIGSLLWDKLQSPMFWVCHCHAPVHHGRHSLLDGVIFHQMRSSRGV